MKKFIQICSSMVHKTIDDPAYLVVTALDEDGNVWVRTGLGGDVFEFFGTHPQAPIGEKNDEEIDIDISGRFPVGSE